MGAEWLAVETINTNSLNPFRVHRHLSVGSICEFGAITGSGTADLSSTKYIELRNQDTKATELNWGFDLPSPIGKYQGTTVSYGVGGLLGGLETLAPGLALMMQPVEIQHLFANDLIDKEATGSNLGWDWRVIGIDEYGGKPAWKIVATHHDIEAYCLGSATMNLWVEEGNPWAAKQTVDVLISEEQTGQSGCSPASQLLNDYVLPEGELELHHTFAKTSLTRGQKQLDLGLTYASKPQANQLGPSNSELEAWSEYELHMPDDSTLRQHTFENALACFEEWPNTIAPGASRALQENGYIWRGTTQQISSATGSNLGWDWRVIGIDEYGGKPAWKIVATHHDIEAYCLGSATMNLWVEEGNPWAAKQTVDVLISEEQTGQSGCSPASQLLNDYVLPEGELELHHTFAKTSLTRGQKQLDLGLTYASKPQANQLGPSNSELEAWSEYELHMPDDSTLRQHTFENALACFEEWPNTIAPGASRALQENGYIWRGTTQQISSSVSQWNLSWVASDEQAGWVQFNLTGVPNAENCQYDKRGDLDLTAFNRDSIPNTFNITALESWFSESSRYDMLSGSERFFTASGDYQDDVQVGYLIAVPGNDIGSILSQIGDGGDGAVTLDLSRTWDENGEHKQLNLIADAAEGRLIGWSLITNPV